MSVAADSRVALRAQAPPGTLAVGIGAFAVIELLLAVFAAVSPHAFYTAIGPFGAFNSHYLRDVASFEGAIGVALAVAVLRPSWRVPVLALTTVQFALHSVNHLIDIGRAHPRWTGYFDFLSLAAATVVLAWLWRGASIDDANRASPAETGASSAPLPHTRKEHHMSRIEGVRRQDASLLVRAIYRLARHEITKLTGQRDRLTGDIPIRAHRPRMLMGYGMLEKAIASKPSIEGRLRALAVLKSAVMQGCEMCQDIGSHEARSAGISEEQLLDLYRYRDSPHFDDTERLVLDLAVGMTLTPVQVSDELFAALHERFDDGELVELVNLIAVENLRSRFNAAFAIGSTGFSEGMTCARMEPGPVAASEPIDATADENAMNASTSLAGVPGRG